MWNDRVADTALENNRINNSLEQSRFREPNSCLASLEVTRFLRITQVHIHKNQPLDHIRSMMNPSEISVQVYGGKCEDDSLLEYSVL
jgi:hypothetical protein